LIYSVQKHQLQKFHNCLFISDVHGSDEMFLLISMFTDFRENSNLRHKPTHFEKINLIKSYFYFCDKG